MKLKELITEAPYLNNEELPYKALSSISVSRLKKSYEKIAEIGSGLDIYQHSNGSIVAGEIVGEEFYLLVSISIRKTPYPVEPTQLSSPLQISMVNISSGEEERGLTKKVYNTVGQLLDLVSDHEQYLGAQGLWKSLARSSDVNIYIFDGRIKDYIRDESGKIIKYNDKNITDSQIWGSTTDHRMIILVGTSKELN